MGGGRGTCVGVLEVEACDIDLLGGVEGNGVLEG